jgi:hypothetical protein
VNWKFFGLYFGIFGLILALYIGLCAAFWELGVEWPTYLLGGTLGSLRSIWIFLPGFFVPVLFSTFKRFQKPATLVAIVSLTLIIGALKTLEFQSYGGPTPPVFDLCDFFALLLLAIVIFGFRMSGRSTPEEIKKGLKL